MIAAPKLSSDSVLTIARSERRPRYTGSVNRRVDARRATVRVRSDHPINHVSFLSACSVRCNRTSHSTTATKNAIAHRSRNEWIPWATASVSEAGAYSFELPKICVLVILFALQLFRYLKDPHQIVPAPKGDATSTETAAGSPYAHFKNSMRKILTVSKAELDAARKKELAKKLRRKTPKQRRAS